MIYSFVKCNNYVDIFYCAARDHKLCYTYMYYMKKWVFSLDLKFSSDGAFLISSGNPFHHLGAAKYVYKICLYINCKVILQNQNICGGWDQYVYKIYVFTMINKYYRIKIYTEGWEQKIAHVLVVPVPSTKSIN